jgi:V8-like Glu-specific endopeptidase
MRNSPSFLNSLVGLVYDPLLIRPLLEVHVDKKQPDSKDSSMSTEGNKSSRENAVRAADDRADDPLFVPHIDALEIVEEATSGMDEYAALLETICGATDDSQAVEQYNGSLGVTVAFVAAHQAPACQVQWNNNLATVYTNPGDVSGVRWGSGTMISDDLFLTCGHLFDQTGGGWQRPRQNGTSNIITPQEIARNMHLNFNFQVDSAGNLRPEQSFPILELIEYRLGGVDMAVCRIGGNPGATFGRTLISTTDAVRPEMLCIIGHPAGLPKRIEAGPTTDISGNFIRYGDIDTLGGNSGSGILRGSDGRLVGVHTNGGCTAASPGDGGTNFGQRIAAVIAASPTLQALLAPKRKVVDDIRTTLKSSDDIGSTKLKFSDDIRTTLKFSDDVVVKLKVLDDTVTSKFRDDIKSPALDKHPALEGKAPAFDNPFDPTGRAVQPIRKEGSNRPFILATPHHSTAWTGQASQESQALSEIESVLAQMEQAMAAGEAELAQLAAEYRELLAEYKAAGGMAGGSST